MYNARFDQIFTEPFKGSNHEFESIQQATGETILHLDRVILEI